MKTERHSCNGRAYSKEKVVKARVSGVSPDGIRGNNSNGERMEVGEEVLEKGCLPDEIWKETLS